MTNAEQLGYRGSRLPLVAVLVSLISLAMLTVIFQRENHTLRTEISEVCEPARSLATEIQLGLAREAAGTRGFLLTGQEHYAAAHREARTMRKRAYEQLLPLARRLGPEVYAETLALGKHLQPPDRLLDALFAGRISPQDFMKNLPAQQAAFEEVTGTVAAIDDDIRELAQDRRRAIDETAQLLTVLTTLLVLVGLGAALLVARLGAGYRALAERLDVRARGEEALRKVAAILGMAGSVREVSNIIAADAVSATGAFGAYVERPSSAHPGEVEIAGATGGGVPPLGARIPYTDSLTKRVADSAKETTTAPTLEVETATYMNKYCKRCLGLLAQFVAEREVLGTLVLSRPARQQPFNADNIRYAQVLGELASTALQRVLLVEEIQRERHARTALLESAREGIHGVDAEGRLTFTNSAAAEMLGYTAEEAIGKSAHALFHHSKPDGAPYPVEQCPMYKTMLTGKGVRVDTEVLWRSDGTPIPVEYSASPIVVDGEVQGVVLVFSDITERKRVEGERERLLAAEQEARADAERGRAELQRANESREFLIRGFTHDVRNPLAVVEAYARSLGDGLVGPLSDAQQRTVRGIQRALGHAVQLLEDLLELAQAEAGEIEVEHMPIDVSAAVHEVVEDFRGHAKAAGLSLFAHAPPRLGTKTDPARLRQILGNLLSNAIKYTEHGGIEVSVEVVRDGPKRGEWLAFRVADTGLGIAEEDRGHVFREFTRLAPQAATGVGLGLAISLRIARLLGGDLTLESVIGRGSVFTLWLPRARYPRSPEPELEEE